MLACCKALNGTGVPILLREHYAMSGTDIGFAPKRLCAHVLLGAMRCAVLAYQYSLCNTLCDVPYWHTSIRYAILA